MYIRLARLTCRQRSFMPEVEHLVRASLEHITDGNNNGQPRYDGESVPTLITEEPVVPTMSLHKLPKLTLPTFCGDVRQWQTFCAHTITQSEQRRRLSANIFRHFPIVVCADDRLVITFSMCGCTLCVCGSGPERRYPIINSPLLITNSHIHCQMSKIE